MSNEKVCGSMALKPQSPIRIEQEQERTIVRKRADLQLLTLCLSIAVILLTSILVITLKALVRNEREIMFLTSRVETLQNDYNQLQQETSAIISEKTDIIENLERLNVNLQIWNAEVNKPLTALTLDDFSQNPISDTPDIYRQKFVDESKTHGIPASLTSAQAMVESNFKKTATYFGGNGSKIINWKQVKDGNGSYKISVVYKNTRVWTNYQEECSLGMAQINLTTHTKVSVQQAYNPDYAIRFMCDRWQTLLTIYPNKSPMFIAMAYNTPGAAIKGESLLNNASLSGEDMERAAFIVKYGERVLSIARQQRLNEIYDELFSSYIADGYAPFVPSRI